MDPAKHQRRSEPSASRWRFGQRHFVHHQGLKALPKALQLGLGHAGSGSACIDEFALRCVVAEQQSPDPMPTPLRITPADDDKFFPIEALDLEPSTPIGLIPAIGALRDNPALVIMPITTASGNATRRCIGISGIMVTTGSSAEKTTGGS